MTDSMLSVDDVYAGYGDTQVLHGVSLHVQEAEIVSLLGRNGVGKTTTLLSILGRIRPTAGMISFAGEDITGLGAADTAQRGIGLVPEERRVFPGLSVEDNLRVAASGGAPNVEGYSLSEVFDIFPRLEERRDLPGSALSGGEQQMLAIGRSLVAGVHLLLLDEPTEGLAPTIVERVASVIQELNERGITILLVEQNVATAMELADRHYFMSNGQVVHEATREQAVGNEEIMRQYLGVTETFE